MEAEIAGGDTRISNEEINRKLGEQAELEVSIASLKAQRELLEEKQAELLVKSPIDGIVVTWDLKKRLRIPAAANRLDADARSPI